MNENSVMFSDMPSPFFILCREGFESHIETDDEYPYCHVKHSSPVKIRKKIERRLKEIEKMYEKAWINEGIIL